MTEFDTVELETRRAFNAWQAKHAAKNRRTRAMLICLGLFASVMLVIAFI